MSKIDDLIEELCPYGVTWRTIGSFASCVVGATPATSVSEYWDGGDIPWMSSGEVNRKTIAYTEKSITHKGLTASSAKLVPPNSVVIALAGQGKTRGLVALTQITLSTNQSLCAMTCDVTVLPGYLYHFLSSRYLELRGLSSGDGGRGGLNLQIIRNYSLPVPPIEVQREIVSSLDKFTQLEAELEAELAARRRQFQYFCDNFFEIEDSGTSKGTVTLGESGKFVKGSGLQKSDFRATGKPCIHYGQIHTTFGSFTHHNLSSIDDNLFQKLKKAKQGDIILADTAEDFSGVGKGTAWLGDFEVAIGGHALIYSHQFDSLFISYFLRSHAFQRQKNALAKGVKVKDISAASLSRIHVPVFDLEKQKSVGQQLKALDSLVNDINIGLPAEIRARRKQYEHYRNKLLTFKELETA